MPLFSDKITQNSLYFFFFFLHRWIFHKPPVGCSLKKNKNKKIKIIINIYLPFNEHKPFRKAVSCVLHHVCLQQSVLTYEREELQRHLTCSARSSAPRPPPRPPPVGSRDGQGASRTDEAARSRRFLFSIQSADCSSQAKQTDGRTDKVSSFVVLDVSTCTLEIWSDRVKLKPPPAPSRS